MTTRPAGFDALMTEVTGAGCRLPSALWLPYDASSLARLGVGGEAVSGLVERGLPADCNRMFVRDSGRELEVRDLPPGRAAFLGVFEDGVSTYWLLIDSGEVWMVRGHEGDGDQQYGLVNSSVAGLQNVLEVWRRSPPRERAMRTTTTRTTSKT